MKNIFLFLLIFLFLQIYVSFSQVADRTIFLKYKSPIEKLSNIPDFECMDDPLTELYIAAYLFINNTKNTRKIAYIKFDRLYNMSSDCYKERTNLWKALEDSILKASKEWEIDPITWEDILKDDKKAIEVMSRSEKEPKINYIYLVIFCFGQTVWSDTWAIGPFHKITPIICP